MVPRRAFIPLGHRAGGLPGVAGERALSRRQLHFIRKLRELGVSHVVCLGTCIQYRIMHRTLFEARPIAPTTCYARCKNELRLALEADARKSGFLFCWGRVFYPYGPGEHPSRLCSATIQKLAGGNKIVLKTPQSTKDYIYIGDLRRPC